MTAHISRRQNKKSAYKHRKKTRTHAHRFMKRLFLFSFIVFLLICTFFIFLWSYLADYQNACPTLYGDQILKAYQQCDTTVIKKYCTNLPSSLSDDLVMHSYLKKNIDTEDLFYYENSISENADEITYTFCKGNQKFADLVVRKTGEKSKYGFSLYEISSLKQYALSYYTLIENPGTCILLDGQRIDDAYLSGQDTLASCFDQIEAGTFSQTTYIVPDYLISTGLVAVDSNKNTCTLTWNEESTVCISSLSSTDNELQSIYDFSTILSEAYARFATIKDADKSSLLESIYSGTAFYKAIKSYDTDWGVAMTSDRFDNVSCSDFMKYSETEYSCQVSLQYVVSQNQTEKEYPLQLTCYITSQSGSLQMVNIELSN